MSEGIELKEIVKPERFIELSEEIGEPFVAFLPCRAPLTKAELIFDLTHRGGLTKPYSDDEYDIAFNSDSEGIYIHVHKGLSDPKPLQDLGIREVHIHPHFISHVAFLPTTGDSGLRGETRNLFVLAELGKREVLTRFDPFLFFYGAKVEIIFPKETRPTETTFNYPLFVGGGDWMPNPIVGNQALIRKMYKALDGEGQPILILDAKEQKTIATCIPDDLFLALEREHGDNIFKREDLYQLALQKKD